MKISIKGFCILKRFLYCGRGTEIYPEDATLHDFLILLAKELGQEFDQLISWP